MASVTVALLGFALPARATTQAQAEVVNPGKVVRISQYFEGGVTYTIQADTENESGPEDTVLRVLDSNDTQVAHNDNPGYFICQPTYLGICNYVWALDAALSFTPTTSGTYQIVVHSKTPAEGGLTDVIIDGSTVLDDVPFSGVQRAWAFDVDDRIRATAQQRECNDPVLMLQDSNNAVFAWDDLSGPNWDAYLQATAAGSSVISGLYPYSKGTCDTARVLLSVDPPGSDADADGISDDLETLVGASTSNPDSDADGIPDSYELFGNDGFSYATGGYNPSSHVSPLTVRNIYVEVDYMWGSSLNTRFLPYTGLATDVRNIFLQDSPDAIEVETFVDGAVPYKQGITIEDDFSCANSPSYCVTFPDLKASHFSGTNSPEIAAHYYYAVFADQLYDANDGFIDDSGIAEYGGNDLIVSLGAFQGTEDEQLGTFIHELGHDLVLLHNGNGIDSQWGPNSLIHHSVMNYRYQMTGLPGTGRHTYSDGTEGCVQDCTTSPKQGCIDQINNAGTCTSDCDCDLDEWGIQSSQDAIDLSQTNLGVNGWGDGSGGTANAPSLPIQAAAHAVSARRPGPQRSSGLVAAPQSDFPRASPSQRRAHVSKLLDQLEARGAKRGVDFVVSDDGLNIYPVE